MKKIFIISNFKWVFIFVNASLLGDYTDSDQRSFNTPADCRYNSVRPCEGAPRGRAEAWIKNRIFVS